MGWNDRVVDDPPYIPYESAADREAYENWQMYLEYCRQNPEETLGGLSSQNVNPEDATRQGRQTPTRTRDLRHLLARLKEFVFGTSKN